MRRLARVSRWVISGAVLLAFGGCVSSQQWMDFTRTELARAVADFVGRSFQLFVQATA